MFISETKYRVTYADTDQMSFVYYGNYAKLFEIGRTESLRTLGISYKDIEDRGIWMPVVDMNLKYHRPAKYDDLLTIKTYVKEIPQTRMKFVYEIYNQNNELLNSGETTLIFLSIERNRPTRCPEWLTEIFQNSFDLK